MTTRAICMSAGQFTALIVRTFNFCRSEFACLELQNWKLLSEVTENAVKCCYWSCALWKYRLVALERVNAESAVVDATVQSALTSGLASAEDYLAILLAHVDYYRRKVKGLRGRAVAAAVERVNERFQAAETVLEQVSFTYVANKHRVPWFPSNLSVLLLLLPTVLPDLGHGVPHLVQVRSQRGCEPGQRERQRDQSEDGVGQSCQEAGQILAGVAGVHCLGIVNSGQCTCPSAVSASDSYCLGLPCTNLRRVGGVRAANRHTG